MQSSCRGQNTKRSTQVCNRIRFAHSLPATFKQCSSLVYQKSCKTVKHKNLKSAVEFSTFSKLFVPFSAFHWDQFSHWQQVWLFLQPVTGEMKKLMFTGFAICSICSAPSLPSLCKYQPPCAPMLSTLFIPVEIRCKSSGHKQQSCMWSYIFSPKPFFNNDSV